MGERRSHKGAGLGAPAEHIPRRGGEHLRGMPVRGGDWTLPAKGESILQGFLIAPDRPITQKRARAEIAFAGASALSFAGSDPATADRLIDLLLARLSTLSADEVIAVLPTIWTGWGQSTGVLDSLRNRERLKDELLLATRRAVNDIKAGAIRVLCASDDIEAAESLLQAETGEQADELRANLASEIKSAREQRELRELREGRPFNALEEIYFYRDTTGLLNATIARVESEETSGSSYSLARALAPTRLISGRAGMLQIGIWGMLYPAYMSGGAEAVRTIIESVHNADTSLTQMVNSRWWLDVAAPPGSPDDSRRCCSAAHDMGTRPSELARAVTI